jgi:hypothetical protein
MPQPLHLGEMLKQSLADKLTQLEKEVFDIGALVPIMEALKQRYEHELIGVGNSAGYHTLTIKEDNRELKIGENVYEECQAAFKRLQDMDTDFHKINTAIGIINKLGYKYIVF